MERVARAIKQVCERLPEVDLHLPHPPQPGGAEHLPGALDKVSQVVFTEPLAYRPFVHLMKAVDVVITDSGGIQEEAPDPGQACAGDARHH